MNKYVEMMRSQADCDRLDAEEMECAKRRQAAVWYRTYAADWQAAADAFEAMVAAIKDTIAADEAALKEIDVAVGGYYPSPETMVVINNLKAALALAEPKEE